MHVECRACGWKQGDFWSDTDNPVKNLAAMEISLLTGRLDQATPDGTIRAEASKRAEEALLRIRNTKWRTLEEFKYDRNASCPVCGGASKLAVVQ